MKDIRKALVYSILNKSRGDRFAVTRKRNATGHNLITTLLFCFPLQYAQNMRS